MQGGLALTTFLIRRLRLFLNEICLFTAVFRRNDSCKPQGSSYNLLRNIYDSALVAYWPSNWLTRKATVLIRPCGWEGFSAYIPIAFLTPKFSSPFITAL